MSGMCDCDPLPAHWICCQLGAREHYAIPRALARRGQLQALLTDAWVHPGSLPGLCKRSLRERFHAELASVSVRAWTARLVAFELVAWASELSGWPRTIARDQWFQARVVDWFARQCVRRVETLSYKPVLFSYSYAALGPLRVAKQRGWRTVLGQIDPGPAEERIVTELRQRFPEYAGAWQPAPAKYWVAWREECELADVVMVNSDWSRTAMLAEGVPAEKIAVVPLAYEQAGHPGHPLAGRGSLSGEQGAKSTEPAFTPSPSSATIAEHGAREWEQRAGEKAFSAERPLRVLFLGQANIRKGIHNLVSAARRLQGETVRFDVIGPHGPLPSSLPENMTFHGAVPRGEAGRWYQQANLFVLPTHSDGFALTQLEAMAYGLPVIATHQCGAVVEPGRSGWIVEAGNPAQLADIVRDAMRNPALLAEMRAAAIRRVKDFSIERLAGRLAEISGRREAGRGEPRPETLQCGVHHPFSHCGGAGEGSRET